MLLLLQCSLPLHTLMVGTGPPWEGGAGGWEL